MTGRTDHVLDDVLGTIGWSPMVRLDRIVRDAGRSGGAILAKLDHLLPGGSKKDRAALAIVRALRDSGQLDDAQPIIALTSGNMGTGLAIVCAQFGHPLIAVMSSGNSPERRAMMRALGARVELVDQVDGTPGQVTGRDLEAVQRHMEALAARTGALIVDQFEHPASISAHAEGTAEEIWAQTGGEIDAFVDFAGSGGTLAGVAQGLRAQRSDIRCYAVEPAGAAALAGAPDVSAEHGIQGGGYARRRLPLLHGVKLDGFLTVTTEEAIATARRLACEEGLFVGPSAGANVAAALRLLNGDLAGARVACVLCDSGMKYLSSGLWASKEDDE